METKVDTNHGSPLPTELINVADQVRAGAKRLEWIVKLAGALEQIGSIEQAEREARARTEAAHKARDAALAQLAESEGKATELLDAAQAQARQIESDARERAAKAQADADALAQRREAEHTERINALKAEEGCATEAAGKARATLHEIQQQVAQATAKLDQIKATARAQLSAIGS